MRLAPADRVEVTTLVDNSSDLLLPDEGLVRRWGLAGPLPVVPGELADGGTTVDVLRAEHGFSALVDVHIGQSRRRILFDAGVTTDGLVANLDRLAIDPATFEAVVFSHGHFDHVMGLHGLARRLGRELPVLVHPDFFTRRRIAGVLDLPTPSRRAIEAAGFAITSERRPSFLLDELLLVTGEVARTTEFEQGMPPEHQAWRNGRWVPDRVVHDDQAVVVQVRDKGLVVLTGCGHAGIVNIVRHAKRLTGVARLYAVLGGLHLRAGPVVDRTVEELGREAPSVVVPAHCTSWRAQHALATALPAAFHPNAVGSTFTL